MAARATWKGFLRLGLVNVPIKVFTATESSGSIGFNELHAECQTRIQRKRWCPSCEREVAYNELVCLGSGAQATNEPVLIDSSNALNRGSGAKHRVR